MREIAKKLKISYNAVNYSIHRTAQTVSNQKRKRSGRTLCTTEQEDKYIRVSSLRNRHLTSPQLVASLNSTCKTPVSTSTVKRRLRDAGLLDRVAKKNPYLRLANKNKRLRWAKEHRHLDGQHPRVPSSLLTLRLVFSKGSLRKDISK
jgi:transposase